MSNQSIFLYSNQPIVSNSNSYYTKTKNFTDFLSELAGKNNEVYRLVIPCKELEFPPERKMTALFMPHDFIKGSYYEGHVSALLANFRNATMIRAHVYEALLKGHRVTVAGPGPNSFLFWATSMLPDQIRYAFFIRGDTLKTVREVYRNSWLYALGTGLVKLFRWRIRDLQRKDRAIVFLFGERLREQYEESCGATHVISPLINESFIRYTPKPMIPAVPPLRILFVGRLSREKNLLALIDAVSLAVQSGRPFFLTIVGEGPLNKKIQNRVNMLKLKEYIELEGYLTHGALADKYDEHDLVCLPSFTEGIPRVIVEALARGTPVLSTPVGSIPQAFGDKIKYIQGFGAENIWDTISWCDDHREEISRMGRVAEKDMKRFLISENAEYVDQCLRRRP
jgi:glycosyltransferase involved in cell wall biosynthesis